MQQAAQRELLLVAAGQFSSGLCRALSADVEALHPIARDLPLQSVDDKAEFRHRTKARRGEIVGKAAIEHQTFFLAVLAEQTDSFGKATGWWPMSFFAGMHEDGAVLDSVQTKAGAQGFRAARAD